MSELMNSIGALVNQVLAGAGDIAAEGIDAATKSVQAAEAIYTVLVAGGMAPGDAVDATEVILREIADKIESSVQGGI